MMKTTAEDKLDHLTADDEDEDDKLRSRRQQSTIGHRSDIRQLR